MPWSAEILPTADIQGPIQDQLRGYVSWWHRASGRPDALQLFDPSLSPYSPKEPERYRSLSQGSRCSEILCAAGGSRFASTAIT